MECGALFGRSPPQENALGLWGGQHPNIFGLVLDHSHGCHSRLDRGAAAEQGGHLARERAAIAVA